MFEGVRGRVRPPQGKPAGRLVRARQGMRHLRDGGISRSMLEQNIVEASAFRHFSHDNGPRGGAGRPPISHCDLYLRRFWCGKRRRAILDQGQRGNNG